MDDERVVREVGRFGLLTGEVMLKSLFWATHKGLDMYKASVESRTFTGQADWFQFLKTNTNKDFVEFLKSEVNLEAFKKELEGLGIGFAFQEQPDGKMLFVYEFKNKALVEKALANVIKQLTEKPKELTRKLAKTPHNMKPADKIKYYKKEGDKLSQMKDKALKQPLSPVVDKGGKTL